MKTIVFNRLLKTMDNNKPKYYDSGSDFDSAAESEDPCINEMNDGTPNDLYRVARTFDYAHHNFHNAQKAFHYYTLAADKNHSDAQYVVGIYHYVGDKALDLPIDYSKSLHYLRLAAYKHHPKAMYMISIAYKFGEGVALDNIHSMKWLVLSTTNRYNMIDDYQNFGIGHKIQKAESYMTVDKNNLRVAKDIYNFIYNEVLAHFRPRQNIISQ